MKSPIEILIGIALYLYWFWKDIIMLSYPIQEHATPFYITPFNCICHKAEYPMWKLCAYPCPYLLDLAQCLINIGHIIKWNNTLFPNYHAQAKLYNIKKGHALI